MSLPHRLPTRLGALALAVALCLSSPGASSASLRSRLSHARSELASLGKKIQQEEAQKVKLENELAGVQTKIDAAVAQVNQLALSLQTLRSRISVAQAHLTALQSQLNQIAIDAYIGSSGNAGADYLTTIFNSTSLPDLSDRIEFMSRISQNDADIATQVSGLKYSLTVQAKQVNTLLAKKSAVVAQLTKERQTYSAAFAKESQLLTQLDDTRTSIVALVSKLKKRIQAAELSGLGNAFQGNNNAPYGLWADGFMKYMGLPSCHNNEVVMVSWQVAEFTQAAWNPLATTWPMPGSSTFNYAGVQNYVSSSQGMDATRLTLRNGAASYGYGAILSSLAKCASPMTTAYAIRASSWCSGCAGGAYVTSVVPKVAANYSVYAKL